MDHMKEDRKGPYTRKKHMQTCSYLAVVKLSGDGLGVGADDSVEQAERG